MTIGLIALVSTIFLTFYNQLVCPFLESLPFIEEFRNLAVVFVFQIAFREILFRTTSPRSTSTPIAKGYFNEFPDFSMGK